MLHLVIPCLSRDWVLGQFSRTRAKAEKEYRQFVKWEIGQETIWNEVKGQSILGEDNFVVSLADHLGVHFTYLSRILREKGER